MIPDSVFVAFSIGLLGAGHCLGMCGGIAGALSLGIAPNDHFARFRVVFTYNIGRILSYMSVGALFGFMSQTLVQIWLQEQGIMLLRSLAGGLMILLGLYLAQWHKALVWLEKLGQHVWRLVKPFGDRFLPVKTEGHALALGLVWGWLPCGLVYSTLAYAMVQGSVWNSTLTMLAFGLGTLPAVLLGGLAGAGLKTWIQNRWFRRISGILLVVFGVWTLGAVYYHGFVHNHAEHVHSEDPTLLDTLYCRPGQTPSILNNNE